MEYFDQYESDYQESDDSPDFSNKDETAGTSDFESQPAEAPHTSPNISKKRKSFSNTKTEKLDYETVENFLKSAHESAFQCCSFLCFAWLRTAVVLFCREKYLLVETTKGRHEWLVQRLDEMQDATKKRVAYSYYVECPDGTKKRCCCKAWDFAYGVSNTTRLKASCRRGNQNPLTSSKKLAKSARRKGLKEKEMFMASWLQKFAQSFGDHLPFGDILQQPEIRLPFGNKRMVYEACCEFIRNDPTNFSRSCRYEDFVGVWKSRKDLKHIKCAKYKPGFAKCTKCAYYEMQMRRQRDSVIRDQLDIELKTHIQEERLEREQYYAAKVKLSNAQISI